MKTQSFLITGGTGKTGRKIVSSLVNKGHNVRIGSRRENPAFDWEDPEGWDAALEGMDKVYICFQPDLAVPGAKEAIETLIEKARNAGVKKLVLLSGKGETEAEACEELVINSGLDYTIIRASWFNQNFSESFFLDPILQGVVALPMAEAKVPYLDTDDIADTVVEVLMDDTHNGQIYELTGPRLMTFEEVVKEISLASGRDIKFVPITLEQYVEGMKEAGIPAGYVWLLEYLFSHVLANPQNSMLSGDVEKVLGRKPKDFTAYAKETAATGVWDAVVKA